MSSYPSGWRAVSLGDSGRWLSGGTPSTSNGEYWDGEIPWISAKSLTEFRLYDSDRRVTTLGAMNGTRLVDAETILMVVRGMSLKSEFRIGIAQRQLTFGQDCKALIARQGIDPQFLAYAIRAKTPQILGIVDEAGHGTGRLNTDQLYGVEIGLPSHAEQRVIADVLGALDDKIEANRKLAATAAQLTSSLYRWALSLPGRRKGRFFDYFRVEYGAAYRGAFFAEPGEGRPLIRVRDLKTYSPQTWTTEVVSGEASVRPGDILVGMDADFRPTAWQGETALLNQRVCRVASDYSRAFTLEAVRAPLQHIEGYKTGTTVIHLNKRDLTETHVELPSHEAARAFDNRASALLEEQTAVFAENRTLVALRDTMLPKLMSGQLRVEEAREAISA